MSNGIRENLLFLLIAHICWLAEPAIVHAQSENYRFINFTQPLSTARGAVTPIGQEAEYLDEAERCTVLVKEFGWKQDACALIDQMLFNMGPIDTLLINMPVSDGYVSLDDFDGSAVSATVDAITDSYTESIEEQSRALGTKIEFLGWRLYPQVDRDRSIMYFANDLNWGGEKAVNISIVLFDRYGYIPMKVIPFDSELSGDELRNVVDQAVSMYKPDTGSSYFQFESGDNVATYGALSVFAGILGVKYGKAASAGLIAAALLFLKKGWFLLLIPLVWIGKRFKKRPPAR